MSHLTHVLWLAEQSWGALGYFWPVTLPLLAGVLAGAVFSFRSVGWQLRRRHLWVLLPFGVSCLILLWGAVMRHTNQQGPAQDWPIHVIYGLLIVQLLTGIGVVGALKGVRWFAAVAVLFEQWVGLMFGFVASMSVTGDWL